MARQYKTGLIITGDASGGIRAIQATEKELGQLNRGFDQGSRRSKRFAQDMGGTSRELQLLRRAAAPVGAVIAGMFAGQALQNQIRFGDELNKLNLRIGAGAEALSEYRYVAEQANVEFGTLATAWQRQTRRLSEAARGTGVASGALNDLNLNAAELNRLAPEEAFERIAASMQGVESQADRTALAMKLWDTEGVRLLQIINQGTDAIADQREEARRLGLTISDETAQAMADYSSAMTRLQSVATGVTRQMMAELVPSMTAGLQATSEWIDEMGGAAQILDTTKDALTGLAVLMAGRYSGSLATATAAKLAATRQAVLYQAALARMAGVSATAAGAQTALAAATRGASGALALIGGPVGAAIIAAGAIYHFRDELGLTEQQIGLTDQELVDFRAELAEMDGDDLGASLDTLNTRLEQATLTAATAREELAALRAEENRGSGALGFGAGQVGAEVRGMQALSAAEEKLAKIKQRRAEVQRELNERSEEGAERIDTMTVTAERAAGVAAEHAKAVVAQTDKTDALAGSLEDLRNRLVPNRRETVQYARDMNALTLAFAAGQIGVSEYLALQARLAESMVSAGDDVRDLADANEDATSDMARAWEEAGNRIDETFADAFRGAFDSFDDFSDRLLDGFKRLLAELAYQATLRPIVVGITASVGGALGIGGSGSAMAGQAGGMGDMSSLVSLGSSLYGSGGQAIGNAWRAFQGAGSTYAGTFGSELAVQTAGGLRAGFDSFAGSSLGAGAINMGAGLAGGWAGSQVFGSSAEGNIGATIGGAIGTIWGPLGTAIGSFLGSGIGSLFGHSPTKPRTEFVTRASDGSLADLTQDELRARDWYYGGHVAQGAFGDVGVTHSGSRRVHRAFDMGAPHEASQWAQELADAAVEMDGFIASLARSDEEVSTMAAAVQELSLRSGDAKKVIDHVLVERPLAALDAVGLQISDRFRHMGVEDFAAELAILLGVTEQLKFTTDRLNIEFDLTADNVLVVAERMSMLAGGLDNLAAIQQGYYQVAFSEAERLGHQASDLQASLSAITDEVPTTVEALRELVEAQSLSSNEGQELALQLMQLAPALAQTRTELERQITEAYQTHLDRIPEASNLAYWVDEVIAGTMTLEDALWSVANSSEAAAYASRQAAEEARRAAEEARREAESAVNAAFSVLRDLVSEQRRATQEAHRSRMSELQDEMRAASARVSEIESVVTSLSRAVDGMHMDTPGQRLMQRQQAQAQITTSLAVARMTGRVNMTRDLENALQVVAEPSEELYGSFLDYQRSFLSTAHDIAAMGELAGEQLTAEEQTLRALERQQSRLESQHNSAMDRYDSMLDSAQDQVNATMRVEDAVRTIPEALNALQEALERYAQVESSGGSSGAGSGSGGSSGAGSGSGGASGAGSGSGGPPKSEESPMFSHSSGYMTSLEKERELWEWLDNTPGISLVANTGHRSSWAGDYSIHYGRHSGSGSIATGVNASPEGSLLASYRSVRSKYGSSLAEALGVRLPQFRHGGIATGPESGYPVELHGTEAVIPLNGGDIPLRIEQDRDNPLLVEIKKLNDKVQELSGQVRDLQASNSAIAGHTSKQASETERMRRNAEQEEMA